MQRSMEVVMAGVLLFVGGSLAGRFIQPRQLSADSDARPVSTTAGLSADVAAGDFQRLADFANRAAATDSPAAVGKHNAIAQTAAFFSDSPDNEAAEVRIGKPEGQQAHESTRQLLEQHFPDVDAQTIDIWTEEYADIPAGDAEFLMEQHQQLRSSLPDSIFAQFGSDVDASSAVELDDNSFGLNSASADVQPTTEHRVLNHNTANRTTVGFRLRRVLTLSEGLRPPGIDDENAVERIVFDFAPGRLVRTGAALDVAIDGHPELMFLLEPGNLVTRCGLFQRLNDGRLGFVTADGVLALSDSPVIPDNAQTPTIDDSGLVRYLIDGESHEGGRVSVVRIGDLHRLTSIDGVLFSIPPSSKPSVVVEAHGMLRPGWLEASNVDTKTAKRHATGL